MKDLVGSRFPVPDFIPCPSDWPPRVGGDGLSSVDSVLCDVALSPAFGNAGSLHFPAALHTPPAALLGLCNASLLPAPKTLSIQVTALVVKSTTG